MIAVFPKSELETLIAETLVAVRILTDNPGVMKWRLGTVTNDGRVESDGEEILDHYIVDFTFPDFLAISKQESIAEYNEKQQEASDESKKELIACQRGDHVLPITEAGYWLEKFCHGLALDCGWWTDLETGESTIETRNVGELIALCHSELSEALEAYRKNLNDDHLPDRSGFAVELADCVIRIFDIAGAQNMELGDIIAEKLSYNARRQDHTLEARRKEGGKKI